MRIDDEFVDDCEQDEIIQIINMNLDVGLRSDYLRIKDGCYVAKPRREKILEEINNILRDNGYEEREIL